MEPFGYNTWAEKWQGLPCPVFLGEGSAGSHLTQCRRGRGLYLHAKFHLVPSNRLATIRRGYGQTDSRQDRTTVRQHRANRRPKIMQIGSSIVNMWCQIQLASFLVHPVVSLCKLCYDRVKIATRYRQSFQHNGYQSATDKQAGRPETISGSA